MTTTGRVARDDTAAGSPPVLARRQDVRVVQVNGGRQADSLDNVAALRDELKSRGALVTKPLEERPWSCRDFYVEDPDGYILCFSEQMTSP